MVSPAISSSLDDSVIRREAPFVCRPTEVVPAPVLLVASGGRYSLAFERARAGSYSTPDRDPDVAGAPAIPRRASDRITTDLSAVVTVNIAAANHRRGSQKLTIRDPPSGRNPAQRPVGCHVRHPPRPPRPLTGHFPVHWADRSAQSREKCPVSRDRGDVSGGRRGTGSGHARPRRPVC